MSRQNEYDGVAVLAITESLMLAINDLNIIPEDQIVGVLQDAESTHLAAMGKGQDDIMHHGFADLIKRIIDSGNSVRRP